MKIDILLTHAGHASSLIVGPIIQPEVGPIISPYKEVGPIIFWLQNFSQMHNLVIFISMQKTDRNIFNSKLSAQMLQTNFERLYRKYIGVHNFLARTGEN